MAWYNINYKCGHKERKQLCGKYVDRDRKIDWLATQLCPDCVAKRHAALAIERGYPQLTGSEKQIAWAIQLRNKAADYFDKLSANASEENREILGRLRDQWIAKETEAKYWIDNRWDFEIRSLLLRLVQTSTGYVKEQK